jgi:hypothetical protein
LSEGRQLRRFLLTFLAVVGLSLWISSVERASGEPRLTKDWVRTADGWESRGVVAARPAAFAPALHPALVATFQLSFSVFCLIAFPTQVVVRRGSR